MPRDRGVCSVCQRDFALIGDGTLQPHRSANSRTTNCEGSRKPPIRPGDRIIVRDPHPTTSTSGWVKGIALTASRNDIIILRLAPPPAPPHHAAARDVRHRPDLTPPEEPPTPPSLAFENLPRSS